MKKIDFHSHILPGMDDGAKDMDTSLALLSDSFKQNVNAVIATPHFRESDSEIDSFVELRKQKYEDVKREAKDKKIEVPEIYLGAEVDFCQGLSDFKNLRKLCIENTDYILLEMPRHVWYDWVFDEIYRLTSKCGLIPILAHLERFSPRLSGMNQFDKVFTLDVVLQFNADSFCGFYSRRKIKNVLQKCTTMPIVLGSDCHDDKVRSSHYNEACRKIKKFYGKDVLDKWELNAEKILRNERVIVD